MDKNSLEKLLADMSIEEKIEQLIQLNGDFYGGADMLTGPAAEFKLSENQQYRIGSVLSEHGAEHLHKLQDKIMEHQPHHIPALFMCDVIHGYKTAFPVPIAQGSSFDPSLTEKLSSAAAKEASAAGIHITFSPMSDLANDSRWGRCMESTGEDPWLNARFAESAVKGFQGNNIKDKGKIGSCFKHFAAYGAVNAGRDYNFTEICERTLMDDHMPAYEAAVKAGACMAMTAFNTINRVPCTTNKKLMKDILRKQLGFDGVLITDYNAIAEAINHGACEDKRDAANKAINAGCDIDMMSDCYLKHLKKLVTDGEVSEKLIDEAVMRVLDLKNQLGLFENPYKDGSVEAEKAVVLCDEHKALARKISEECMVLLKNNGILPLDEKSEIAVIGSLADSHEITGSWAIFADRNDTVTMKQALSELYPNADIIFVDSDNAEEAAAAAKNKKAVILALGESEWSTGESKSISDIGLSAEHHELFDAVYNVNPNIVTVLFGGRPLAIPEIAERSAAVLEAWLPGTFGTYALADILFGKVNPSGRLSMSFPYSTGQLPFSYRAYNSGRPKPPAEGFVPFSSNYMDVPNEPLYPFGYGLSYTNFEYSKPALDSCTLSSDGKIIVSVTVKNTGKMAGLEPVQLYIRDDKASVVRPVRELKGVQKIYLEPNEEKTVQFEINEDMLKFYDIDMNYTAEKGSFTVWIGGTSLTDNKAEFKFI